MISKRGRALIMSIDQVIQFLESFKNTSKEKAVLNKAIKVLKKHKEQAQKDKMSRRIGKF